MDNAMNGELTTEQKLYLEGFTSGLQAGRTARGQPPGANGAPAGVGGEPVGPDAAALQQFEASALAREQFEGARQQAGEGKAEDQRFQRLDGGGFEHHGHGFQRLLVDHGAHSLNREAKL